MWQALACEQCSSVVQVYCCASNLYFWGHTRLSWAASLQTQHELPLRRGCLVTVNWSMWTFSANFQLWTKWNRANSVVVFVWTKSFYLIVQVQLTSIIEHARGNDRSVTDVSLAPVESSWTACGTCASVFTRLGKSLLSVALSLMSMLLVALSSLVSILAVSSCLWELTVSHVERQLVCCGDCALVLLYMYLPDHLQLSTLHHCQPHYHLQNHPQATRSSTV